jgi:hypothetical protein
MSDRGPRPLSAPAPAGPALPLASVALSLAFALVAGCARPPEVCDACGREVHPALRVTLRLEGKRDLHACCPRCALHFRDESEAEVSGVTVSDYASEVPLDLESAWLVEGSDEIPCVRHAPTAGEGGAPLHRCYDRCVPSLIAFAGETAARAFVQEHGGRLRPPGDMPYAKPSAAPATH